MDTSSLFQHLGIALAIGLLIGLERGWQERQEASGARVSGIRTFALTGLSGGIWGALFPIAGAVPLGFAFAGFAAALTAFEWRQSVAENDFSATGLIAGLLTFSLGAYAVLGDARVAGAAAVAVFGLLAEREALHGFLQKITWPELRAALVLLAMSFVLLPVLPDKAIDPYGVFNPYLIWLMTVMIAAISFAGYIAVRMAGARQGLLYAGAVGGLISSTTVTLTYSQLAQRQPGIARETQAGIVVSWCVSLIRLFVLAGVVAPALIVPLLPAVASALAVLVIAALAMMRTGAVAQTPAMGLTNPFELGEVLRFGALLAVIMAAAKLLMLHFGARGLLPLAAVTGLADPDPIILSVARILGAPPAAANAVPAILIAVAANSLTRIAIALALGRARAWPLAVTTFGAIAAGAITYLTTRGI